MLGSKMDGRQSRAVDKAHRGNVMRRLVKVELGVALHLASSKDGSVDDEAMPGQARPSLSNVKYYVRETASILLWSLDRCQQVARIQMPSKWHKMMCIYNFRLPWHDLHDIHFSGFPKMACELELTCWTEIATSVCAPRPPPAGAPQGGGSLHRSMQLAGQKHCRQEVRLFQPR